MHADNAVDHVDAFVSFKRARGYSYARPTVLCYRRLASFLDENRRPGGALVEKEAALKWIEWDGYESRTTCNRRATELREFTKYLIRVGHSDCYLLPTELIPKKDKSFKPYIFTHEEIEEVTRAFDAMRPHVHSPRVHLVYPAMFRVIYGCGLRISEALGLRMSAVDLDRGVLTIRDSKGGTSRYVPMSDSLRDYLSRYVEVACDGTADPDPLLFPSPSGGMYRIASVEDTFYTRFRRAGVTGAAGSHPRVHDLRHTFAVHSLQAAAARGSSAQAFLPILMAYMGHKDVNSTEYYLHLTLEGQDAALEKMSNHYKDIFKEVDADA